MPEHIMPISLGLMDGLRSSDEDASMVLMPPFALKFYPSVLQVVQELQIGGASPWHRDGLSVSWISRFCHCGEVRGHRPFLPDQRATWRQASS
jgi:hypothetical protein